MTEVLREKTELYRCEAKLPGVPRFMLPLLLASCALIFFFGGKLPYGVFLKIGALVLAAFGVNWLMKRGLFDVTYVLTDDGTLVYVTKYGFLSKETAWIDTAKAEFKFEENAIIFENRKYDFYPDEELLRLLKSGQK